MSTTSENFISKFRNWIRQSLYIKIASIGFIIILLMIPNSIIKNLIHERNYRQQEVISEVSNKWGNAQQVIGPVLTIPYKTFYENQDGKKLEIIKHCNFLPEQIEINGEINPESRKRGIYNVVLYQTSINSIGYFKQPDIKKLGISEENVLFDKAFIQISISDMAGINDKIKLTFDNDTYRMESGIKKMNGFNSGVKIPIKLNRISKELKFSFDLNLNGSHFLTFGPVGKETLVNLNSTWGSPSFMGSFLPDDRSISKEGFNASWKILDLNRNYPQSWIGEQQNLLQSSFGVELIQTVDEYSKNLRSAKYALLVISLTFLVFFFFEVINKQKVHPMHYTLIGLSISIFYFLLLSLSEHIGFNLAYLISSTVIVGMIVSYSLSIFDTKFLTIVLLGILSSIMGFIFIILQLEDFALLAGSVGLAIVVASVMYYSRTIDWNNVGKIV